jgi:hypothetical protein
MSGAASPRAASPRSTTRDSVRISDAHGEHLEGARLCRVALTHGSPGIVHHPHSCPRRWLVPAVARTAHRPGFEQESAHRHDLCPQHWTSQAAQGARECEWVILHWQVMAHGRPIHGRELRALEPKGRRGGPAEELGWREGIHRDHQQAVLLGGRDCKREGVLHRQHGQDLQQVHQGRLSHLDWLQSHRAEQSDQRATALGHCRGSSGRPSSCGIWWQRGARTSTGATSYT